jgi:hypothetical protein
VTAYRLQAIVDQIFNTFVNLLGSHFRIVDELLGLNRLVFSRTATMRMYGNASGIMSPRLLPARDRRQYDRMLLTIAFSSELDHENRVIPDLSTASNIAVSQVQHALLVSREGVESKDGKWFVTVKAGEQFTLREVKIGMSDNLHVAVLEGVREGEEAALYRPAAVPRIS